MLALAGQCCKCHVHDLLPATRDTAGESPKWGMDMSKHSENCSIASRTHLSIVITRENWATMGQSPKVVIVGSVVWSLVAVIMYCVKITFCEAVKTIEGSVMV